MLYGRRMAPIGKDVNSDVSSFSGVTDAGVVT